jgi:hypothetical protein
MTTPSQLRRRYKLTTKDLSAATGAHQRTVKKWEASPDIELQERYATRIEGLASVLEELDGFSLSFIHAWLRQPRPALGGLTPRDALRQDRWDEVQHLARLTRSGAPPDPTDVPTDALTKVGV